MRLKIFISLLLAGVTLAIYWPARHFDLIYFDDPLYLLIPDVAKGLSDDGINWATSAVIAANWHPATSFSFLLTHQFYGLNPGAEHLVNLFFHAANVVLLFLVLLQMTGANWRSAMVAAIFAWHPLRVESVAWITERKDVLFLFFMLLALLGYTRYARAGKEVTKDDVLSPPTHNTQSRKCWYALTLLFFILSLMSKAMVVTLPFLLLLLDFWPFRRLNWPTLRPLVIEKIPFFVLTILFCSITFQIQKTTGAVVTVEDVGTAGHAENAALSYVSYLGKFCWPTDLALLYPYPKHFDSIQVLLDGLLLLAISAWCLTQSSRRPYLAVGWFWYLGTLIPVIGLVQIGEAALADRYTYLPLIGPVISIVWLISEWAGTIRWRQFLAASVAAVVLCAGIFLSRAQVMLWQNSATLFAHSAEVTSDNSLVEFPLAQGLEQEGRLRQAAVHYQIAIAMKPQVFHLLANINYAGLLNQLGCYQAAAAHLDAALQLNPNSAIALNNLAWLLATCPDPQVRNGTRAVELGERLCKLTNYQETMAVGTLAAAYAEAGRYDDAVKTAQQAIALAEEQGETALARNNEALLQYYLAHKAYRDKGHLTSDGT